MFLEPRLAPKKLRKPSASKPPQEPVVQRLLAPEQFASFFEEATPVSGFELHLVSKVIPRLLKQYHQIDDLPMQEFYLKKMEILSQLEAHCLKWNLMNPIWLTDEGRQSPVQKAFVQLFHEVEMERMVQGFSLVRHELRLAPLNPEQSEESQDWQMLHASKSSRIHFLTARNYGVRSQKTSEENATLASYFHAIAQFPGGVALLQRFHELVDPSSPKALPHTVVVRTRAFDLENANLFFNSSPDDTVYQIDKTNYGRLLTRHAQEPEAWAFLPSYIPFLWGIMKIDNQSTQSTGATTPKEALTAYCEEVGIPLGFSGRADSVLDALSLLDIQIMPPPETKRIRLPIPPKARSSASPREGIKKLKLEKFRKPRKNEQFPRPKPTARKPKRASKKALTLPSTSSAPALDTYLAKRPRFKDELEAQTSDMPLLEEPEFLAEQEAEDLELLVRLPIVSEASASPRKRKRKKQTEKTQDDPTEAPATESLTVSFPRFPPTPQLASPPSLSFDVPMAPPAPSIELFCSKPTSCYVSSAQSMQTLLNSAGSLREALPFSKFQLYERVYLLLDQIFINKSRYTFNLQEFTQRSQEQLRLLSALEKLVLKLNQSNTLSLSLSDVENQLTEGLEQLFLFIEQERLAIAYSLYTYCIFPKNTPEIARFMGRFSEPSHPLNPRIFDEGFQPAQPGSATYQNLYAQLLGCAEHPVGKSLLQEFGMMTEQLQSLDQRPELPMFLYDSSSLPSEGLHQLLHPPSARAHFLPHPFWHGRLKGTHRKDPHGFALVPNYFPLLLALESYNDFLSETFGLERLGCHKLEELIQELGLSLATDSPSAPPAPLLDKKEIDQMVARISRSLQAEK